MAAAISGKTRPLETRPLKTLHEPRQVACALTPMRQRVLTELAQADSAAGIARRLGLPRQKVNYHVRQLEKEGLLELVEERQRRGCTERCYRASARAFLVSPTLLGPLPREVATQERFSSAYLLATAAETVRQVALLRDRAEAVDKPLATMTADGEVAFASPAEFRAFSEELATAIGQLVARYDRPDLTRARRYRLLAAVHPEVTKSEEEAQREEVEAKKTAASETVNETPTRPKRPKKSKSEEN